MHVLVRKARSALYHARKFFVSQRFGFDPVKIYKEEFYEDGGFINTERSARAITEWMERELDPRSVLDLGSGAGYYLTALQDRGIRAVGLEASPAGIAASGAGTLAFTYDLRRPLYASTPFDVVMCIEVAEHIPRRYSETVVQSICRNAGRFAVFTAAPPGTPGSDHINCQPAQFWLGMFRRNGFELRADLTDSLRRAAAEANAAEWWRSWSWCLERATASTDAVPKIDRRAVLQPPPVLQAPDSQSSSFEP